MGPLSKINDRVMSGRQLACRGRPSARGRRAAAGPLTRALGRASYAAFVQTSRTLDRYLRLRRARPRANSPAFWLGGRGQRFGYAALYKALGQRVQAAGLEHLYSARPGGTRPRSGGSPPTAARAG